MFDAALWVLGLFDALIVVAMAALFAWTWWRPTTSPTTLPGPEAVSR